MYLIRRAHPDDMSTLLKLAKMVHFINLPADKEIIGDKIRRSLSSFRGAAIGAPPGLMGADRSAVGKSPLFMFVIEDTETRNTLGTSMVISRMGGPGHPNVAFELRRREFFSTDLQTGVTHITAKLFLDESGPTEIGGLILNQSVRGGPQKIGKQLSLIRFHYMGLHREYFSDRVLAEMMAPITPDGQNTLWEYLGRRFINLSYSEADKFCQHSREFMTSLLPREEIYLTLLPAEARALVGQVGPDTVPARRMLEDLGFRYTNHIDPFDGGPHLEVATNDIALVRDTRRAEFAGICAASQAKRSGFVSAEHEDGEFRALYTQYQETADGSGIKLPKEQANLLLVNGPVLLGLTPFDLHKSAASAAAPAKTRKRGSKVTA